MDQCAEQDGDPVQTRRSKTLIIRHLPSELNRDEKEDLLRYFGAVSVRAFSDRGLLKHTAFASFASEKSAAKALGRLHQLKILNHTLVVEFAKDQDAVTVLKNPPVSDSLTKEKDVKKKDGQQPSAPLIETGAAPSLGLKFQVNPSLKYLYPPPSGRILTNITHALISVPKFYVQVLHLMNKMNLPCPFGAITAAPPLYESVPVQPPPMPPLPPEYPPLPEEEMEFSSEEESEYESEDGEEKERMVRMMGIVNQQCKRLLRTKRSSTRKKPKLKDLLFAPKADAPSGHAPALQPSDVFEQAQALNQKKIEFHISADVSELLDRGAAAPAEEPKGPEVVVEEETLTLEQPADGFGKIYPVAQVAKVEEDSDEDTEIPSEFISRRELEKGRLTKDEIKRMSVFKNYEPGDPTCRLYVKNIAKQVEEKDLRYIYGRYVDMSSETERNMFDVVLMKEGRMKGQAFIGLPSETSAAKALRDTNGFVLQDKPLIVQFARSARPKEAPGDLSKTQKRR
ncbi:RNA-binding region-containing protein 3 [Brienomyrus brachyistius]|uniref:RNA-binding region-containing protein 3 n=1 Tax=Brienomyrus brachyistius TaxID=42636 RepID=UPI0020B44711|nr:RNA-binding region-containing protein 3 [Brienomyrus brachyistius]XP_048882473.1 RNA-binding region-containing protein 3 [Brienomyrus brachyistius]